MNRSKLLNHFQFNNNLFVHNQIQNKLIIQNQIFIFQVETNLLFDARSS